MNLRPLTPRLDQSIYDGAYKYSELQKLSRQTSAHLPEAEAVAVSVAVKALAPRRSADTVLDRQ